ncbi:MAG: Protein translocase subunit SecE [Dehalococcoidia bacterium]|nr:Protein translocase subunit SecE [Dehalococcoidia bacterium]
MRMTTRAGQSDEAQGTAKASRPARRPVMPKGRTLNFQFARETVSELKKVTWPSRKQTTNLTVLVIVVSVAVGLMLGVIDWVFLKVVDNLLLGVGR